MSEYPTILRPYDSLEGTGTSMDPSYPSMTKQAFKDECDINFIMKRWKRTGIIDHVSHRKPEYSDYTGPSTYLEALEVVQDAQDEFDTLSAPVRTRFNNDPSELLRFVSDPNNQAEALELGLVDREIVPAQPAQPPEPQGKTEGNTPVSGGE